MTASIVGLGGKSKNIIHPKIAMGLSPGRLQAKAAGLPLLQEPRTTSVHMERGIMKALIAALGLVTLLASPTFAQTAPTDNSPTCAGYGWGPSSPCYGP